MRLKIIFATTVFVFLCGVCGLAAAQPNKCVVNGKVLYTDGECPTGATQERHKSRDANSPAILPKLQHGLWKIKSNSGGNVSESDFCGNPLDRILESLRPTQSLGCTSQITSPAPRATRLIVDCAADRQLADGSASVSKGKRK